MKLLSIDVQASHGDPSIAEIFEFTAVGFDTETEFKPLQYKKRFVPPTVFNCSIEAMLINHNLLKQIKDYKDNKLVEHTDLFDLNVQSLFNDFFQWATTNELAYHNGKAYRINTCGKNFSHYGLPLLVRNNPNWANFISRRIVNLAEYYTKSEDTLVPDTEECRRRSGLFMDSKGQVTALEVAQMIHHKLSQQ